jgi:hypothetical protein
VGTITGIVSGTSDGIGGIVGTAYRNIEIKNCYSTVTIDNSTGNKSGAGIIGGLNMQNTGYSAVVQNSAYLGNTILAVAASAGRIAGYLKSGSDYTFTNNFAFAGTLVNTATVTGTATDKNGANKSGSALRAQSTYATWDFTDVWTLGNGDYPLPILKAFSAANQPLTLPAYLEPGTVTITNEADLRAIAAPFADVYELSADIALTSPWTPLANFSAVFDGKNHTISGLNVSGTADNAGLFGSVTGNAEIKNLVVSGTVSGGALVGGIAGALAGNLTLSRVAFIGNVTGTGLRVGGLVGGCASGTYTTNIDNSYFNGQVASPDDAVGGLIGGITLTSSGSTTISKSYVVGSISSSLSNAAVGGITGSMSAATGTSTFTVSDCVVVNPTLVGSATATRRISGWHQTDAAKLTTTLSNNLSFFGALVNGSEVSGSATDANGANTTGKGLTTQSTYAGWDFTDAWQMSGNKYALPVLKSFATGAQPEDLPEALKITIPAGGSKTADYYISSDILFLSDDTNGTGQLTGIPEGGLAVNGAVKLQKTFTEEQWYPVGFPFAIASVVDAADETALSAYDGTDDDTGNGDYWIKTYNGATNLFEYPGATAAIAAHTGYIIQFPDFYEGETPIAVIFTSTANPTLKNTTEPSQTLTATADNHGYYLVANPSAANIASLNGADRYYKYDSETNNFALLDAETDIALKPFEAIVAVKQKDDSTPFRVSLGTGEDTTITGLTEAVSSNDPVVETKYYNLQGIEIQKPAQTGIYVVKKIHASRKATVEKELNSKK